MAPSKDKWVRRFVISETSRHKKGFTVYKVTSVMFLKISPDVVSKVSVWKRYSDFKKLYNTIQNLHSNYKIKESLPLFPKPKFFGRFEAEVIEERRLCALTLLEFIGHHSELFTSDIFVKFFENDNLDKRLLESSNSLSSDTSEEVDCENKNNVSTTSFPKFVCTKKMTPVIVSKHNHDILYSEAHTSKSTALKRFEEHKNLDSKNNFEKNSKDVINGVEALNCEENESKITNQHQSGVVIHDGSDLTQCIGESAQYILIAAAHMSAAFRHEAIAEYEEAFTQYKLGTSHLINGCQLEIDPKKKLILQEKIKKYLQRAERLYNRHLNCNVSALHKPVIELKNYKVVKLMDSVMLVKDILQEFERIIKSVEKVAGYKKDISKYILRGKVPYMVQLYSCIETDSTVFLVLQYISKGRMWDFLKSEYKIEKKNNFAEKRHLRSISCNAVFQSNFTEKFQIKENLPVNPVREKEINFFETSKYNFFSLENKLPSEDVTELVKNAQKLLQSVNDTLKQSTSIKSRLNESEHVVNKPIVKKKAENGVSKMDDSLKNDSLLTKNNEHTEYSENFSKLSISDSYTELNNDKSEYTDLRLREQLNKNCKAASIESYLKLNDFKSVNISKKKSSNKIISYENKFLKTHVEHLCTEENKMWTIPESVVKLWSAQILLALEALHQQDVIISDLRPDNILVDDFFNVSMTYIVPRKNTELLRLKRPYSSPELCMLTPPISITSSADVWSFGVILYELLTGFDFASKHPGQFYSHSLLNIPDNLSNNAKSLLLDILKYQPSDRLTIPEIKQTLFFSNIDWLELLNHQV